MKADNYNEEEIQEIIGEAEVFEFQHHVITSESIKMDGKNRKQIAQLAEEGTKTPGITGYQFGEFTEYTSNLLNV